MDEMLGSNFEKAMDPELRVVFRTLPPIHTAKLFDDLSTTREIFRELAEADRKSLPEDVSIKERSILGTASTPDVHIKIYKPRLSSTTALPAMLWIHGGGFILDFFDLDDTICCDFVKAANCVVVSVDWRVAPEHPFPAGLEDCYTVLRWVVEHAGELGVDVDRVAVGGSSAGGGLCAGVALLARDRGGPRLCFQMPLCACLDDRHITLSSHEITDPRIWNRDTSLRAWKMYLGNSDSEKVSPYAAPSRAEDLSSLPPAYMMCGEIDLVRDENIKYANRLMQAGVPTELHIYPRAFHSFESVAPTAAISQRAYGEYMDALKRAVNP